MTDPSLFSDENPRAGSAKTASVVSTSGGVGGPHLPQTRPVQQAKLLLDAASQRLVIRASAGTGKTFQLTNRYLTLLRSAAPDEILASTFTRKAAGEILERILTRLAAAVLDPANFAELQKFLGEPALSVRECTRMLTEFTRNLHRVRISTLDGFFSRLAGSFALELGLPPGWRIMEPIEDAALRDQAIELVVRKAPIQEVVQLMHLLDKGSAARSVHDLIAGKVGQFYDLYRRSDAAAWNRFPDTGKFLSAAEQAEILTQMRAVKLEDGRFGTRRDRDVELMLAGEWDVVSVEGLMPRVLKGETYYGKDIPDDLGRLYLQIAQHVLASVLLPWKQQTLATYELLHDFHRAYERLKTESKGVRFDDITLRLADAFRESSPHAVSFRLDGSIGHILLDEFQDTSTEQWHVLRPFAEQVCQFDSTSFFCVGDVKQAIYGWRGGEAAIFDAIEQELPRIEQRALNESYRSSPVIMETVNRVFQGMGRHDGLGPLTLAVQHWSHAFPEHKTAKRDLPGFARVQTGPIPEGMEPDGKNLWPINQAFLPFVAQYIAERVREAPLATIGVLTRKNETVGKLIFELNRLGIEASEEGGNPLTDSAAVQLILSLLMLADHPGHTTARFHVWNSPLASVVDFPIDNDDEAVHQFALDFRQRLVRLGYGPVIHELTNRLATHCNPRELKRLVQLSAVADNYDALQLTLRPSRFVEYIEQQKVQEPTSARVRVMTVHQSKGLEFDIVVLPDLDSDLTRPPSYVSHAPRPGARPDFVALGRDHRQFDLLPEEMQQAYRETMAGLLEESLCLLYVALTRAISGLHILVRPRNSKSDESQLPKTFAGLIRAAVAPEKSLDSERILFEMGDPQWYEKIRWPAEHLTQAATEPQAVSIRFKEGERSRHIQRIAPSSEEGDRLVKLSHVLPLGDSAAMDRGTMFHKWLEQVRWIDEARPADETLRRLGRELGAQHLDLDRSVTQFHTMLRVPQVAWTLSKRAYANPHTLPYAPSIQAEIAAGPVDLEVINERQFSVIDGDRIINGTIDRIVLIKRNWQIIAADVLDFKTDALPETPEGVQEKVEYYRGQLSAYVRAVTKLYHLPPERISARLLLLGAGRVETVDVQQLNAAATTFGD